MKRVLTCIVLALPLIVAGCHPDEEEGEETEWVVVVTCPDGISGQGQKEVHYEDFSAPSWEDHKINLYDDVGGIYLPPEHNCWAEEKYVSVEVLFSYVRKMQKRTNTD